MSGVNTFPICLHAFSSNAVNCLIILQKRLVFVTYRCLTPVCTINMHCIITVCGGVRFMRAKGYLTYDSCIRGIRLTFTYGRHGRHGDMGAREDGRHGMWRTGSK